VNSLSLVFIVGSDRREVKEKFARLPGQLNMGHINGLL